MRGRHKSLHGKFDKGHGVRGIVVEHLQLDLAGVRGHQNRGQSINTKHHAVCIFQRRTLAMTNIYTPPSLDSARLG